MGLNMSSTRRTFLKNFSVGALATGGLLTAGVPAQETCRRISGAGSYLLGPFLSAEARGQPAFMVADLGFDETMVYCTIRTNYASMRFPTATMGDVELGAHEFYMDMESVRINSLDIQDSADGPQAVFSGILRSETRLFSGDKMKTIIEGHITFGCYATQLNPGSSVEVSKQNFSMTANFDPKREHAAIFGEQPTFGGHLARGSIVVLP